MGGWASTDLGENNEERIDPVLMDREFTWKFGDGNLEYVDLEINNYFDIVINSNGLHY